MCVAVASTPYLNVHIHMPQVAVNKTPNGAALALLFTIVQ